MVSFARSPSSLRMPPDWLFSLQVAEAVCPVQVGGGGSHGAEDGHRAGPDEIYAAPLQVFLLAFFVFLTLLFLPV